MKIIHTRSALLISCLAIIVASPVFAVDYGKLADSVDNDKAADSVDTEQLKGAVSADGT